MWTSCGWVTPIIITVCVVTGVIHVDKLWLGDSHNYNSVCCYRRDTCGQAVAG